jgi:hypothetical protein
MKFNEVALALPPEDRGDLIARLSCQMAVRIRIQSARLVSNQFSFNTSTAARLRLLQKYECDLGFLAPPSGRCGAIFSAIPARAHLVVCVKACSMAAADRCSPKGSNHADRQPAFIDHESQKIRSL